MATQAERRTNTRAHIITTAQKLFVQQGYGDTSTEGILAAAEISRGAMYHHFATKKDLFEAVFLATSDAAIQRAGRAAKSSTSPLKSLTNACLSWLKEVRKPDVATILIDQGPQVLGWKRARDLESDTSLGLVTSGLKAAMDAGEINVPSLELAARFLNAALTEAALISLLDKQRVSQAEVEASLLHFMAGMTRSPNEL